MTKALIVVNVVLTLPFGVAALIAPEPLFMQFGLSLDPAGALVARGYGATLVGYGAILWFLRGAVVRAVVKPVLVSLILFNAIEAAIQGAARISGVAAGIIFLTVAVHFLVAAWSVVALARGGSAH
jgi:hypothetical protein